MEDILDVLTPCSFFFDEGLPALDVLNRRKARCTLLWSILGVDDCANDLKRDDTLNASLGADATQEQNGLSDGEDLHNIRVVRFEVTIRCYVYTTRVLSTILIDQECSACQKISRCDERLKKYKNGVPRELGDQVLDEIIANEKLHPYREIAKCRLRRVAFRCRFPSNPL